MAIVLIGGYLRMYPEVSYQDYCEEHIKDKLGSIDLNEITKDELATRHDAAVRATFEPEWELLEKDLDKSKDSQRNQNAKKLVSILSLLPESAIIPKNRLIVYSGVEKIGKTKLERPADRTFNFLDTINLLEILEEGKSVRLHPLLKEFIYEKVKQDKQQQQVQNLKIESLMNLKKKYYDDDFSYLVNEYIERDLDIDSILDDFRTVFGLSLELQNEILQELIISNLKLSELYRVLEQESYNLRAKDKDSFVSLPNNIDKALLFAQQIHIRSSELSNTRVIERSKKYLETKRNSFIVKWARVKDKSALLRTLTGHTRRVTSVAITSDNTKVVSGSDDNTVRVWDLNNSSNILICKFDSFVSAINLSNDNKNSM